MSLRMSWPPWSGFSFPISFLKQAHFPFSFGSDLVLSVYAFKTLLLPAILLPCFLSFEQSYRKFFIFLKMHMTVPALLRGTVYKHTPTYLFQVGGQIAFHHIFPLKNVTHHTQTWPHTCLYFVWSHSCYWIIEYLHRDNTFLNRKKGISIS